MKKSIKVLSGLLLMTTLFSCGNENSSSNLINTSSFNTSKTTSEKQSIYGLTFIVGTEKKETYNKEIDLNSIDNDIIRLKVTKDDEEVNNEEIIYSVDGDQNTIKSIDLSTNSNHNYATVNFNGVGNVTITFSLALHNEVSSVSVTYNVTQGFLNKTIMRGDIKEENGVIIIPSKVQATAVAAKADTKWVLSAIMEVPLYSSSESFGMGSFIDEGNIAFWSALRNSNKTKDGKYDIYVRDFFSGWDTPSYDKEACLEYKNLDFPLENEKTIVDFKLIRNGLNYYFEINGYHYQYESKEEKPTYPGFFSQNQSAEIKNYQVNYDQKCVDEAIEKEWNDNSKLDILKFLEKDSTSIKAGESRSFNVVKAPEYAKENYVFDVNEEYKDFVVIENNLIKVNENAPEGLLEVTLSSESKKITDKYSIQITKDVQITENDYILATGGSYLSSSNSIVFPETLFENNGIGNETKYDSSPTYGAILKQKVYGCSFTLEFDVNNYNGHGQEKNNLLISLGGRFNQYYFFFGNGVANVNVYTQSLKQNRTNEGSNIIANQLSGLDGNNHHVRIHSNEGTIEITIDNKEVVFSEAVPLMNLSSFFMELPVRIATNNASCEINNIVTTKGEISNKNVYSHNSNYVYQQDDKYVISMLTNNGWNYRDRLDLNACTFKEFGKCQGAYIAKFKANLEGAESSSKLCIRIGDEQEQEAQICFGENKIENGSFKNSSSINISKNDTIYVTIYRNNNGKANVGVAKNENDEPTYIAKEFENVSDNGIWLWARNSKNETTKKVYIENIVVENL